MKVESSHNGYRTPFKATVIQTPALTNTLSYLEQHTHPQKGWYNSTQHLSLTKKIIKALEEHPSTENIEIEQTYRYNEMINARGVISSGRATLVDTEPARSDSIASVLNIMRRIVDPHNKKSFNKLMGEEYSGVYNTWWNKNIKPIWGKVNESFRESTRFEGNNDSQVNKLFNEQSGEKRQVTSTMVNGQFVDYTKIKEAEQTAVVPPKEQKKDNIFITYLREILR